VKSTIVTTSVPVCLHLCLCLHLTGTYARDQHLLSLVIESNWSPTPARLISCPAFCPLPSSIFLRTWPDPLPEETRTWHHPCYTGWGHHIWAHPYHIGTIHSQPTLATCDDGIWAHLYLRWMWFQLTHITQDHVIAACLCNMGWYNRGPFISYWHIKVSAHSCYSGWWNCSSHNWLEKCCWAAQIRSRLEFSVSN